MGEIFFCASRIFGPHTRFISVYPLNSWMYNVHIYLVTPTITNQQFKYRLVIIIQKQEYKGSWNDSQLLNIILSFYF